MNNIKINDVDFEGKLLAIKKLGKLNNNIVAELIGFNFFTLKIFFDLKNKKTN